MKKFALPFLTTMGEGAILKLTEWNEKNSVVSTTRDASGGTTTETAASQTRKMFIDNFKQMWNELMAMAGEVPNILYVPSGTRLVAYPSQDLWLRSTEDDVDAARKEAGDLSKALLGKTGSWTKGRKEERDNRDSSSSSSNSQKDNKKDEASGEESNETVYVPDDITDRMVDPVSQPQQEPRPTYF